MPDAFTDTVKLGQVLKYVRLEALPESGDKEGDENKEETTDKEEANSKEVDKENELAKWTLNMEKVCMYVCMYVLYVQYVFMHT